MDLENKYGTLEIQKELLKLLKEFDAFCQEGGVKYSLDSGSLLGAVRHKGFIPWDDDLDVVMDRDNYNKLISIIGSSDNLSIERITEATLWVDRIRMKKTEYRGSYKPTLDVFIFDPVPGNQIAAKFKLLTLFMLQGMIKYHLSLKKGNIVMKMCSLVTWLMGKPFSHKTKYLWYNKVSSWGDKRKCTQGSCYNYTFSGMGLKFDSDILDEVVRMPFEDIEVWGLKKYDHFLSTIYGDYMTPPKTTERVPKHL